MMCNLVWEGNISKEQATGAIAKLTVTVVRNSTLRLQACAGSEVAFAGWPEPNSLERNRPAQRGQAVYRLFEAFADAHFQVGARAGCSHYSTPDMNMQWHTGGSGCPSCVAYPVAVRARCRTSSLDPRAAMLVASSSGRSTT